MVMHDGAQEQCWRWTKAIRNAILWWNGNHYNNRNTVLITWRAIWCRWSLAYWWPIESVIVRPVCCAILVSQLHNSLNDSSDRFSVRESTFNHLTNVGDSQTNRQCQSGRERIKNSKNILVLVPCTAPNADKRRLEEKSKSKEKKKRRLLSDFNEVIHSFTFYLILSRIHTSHTHGRTRGARKRVIAAVIVMYARHQCDDKLLYSLQSTTSLTASWLSDWLIHEHSSCVCVPHPETQDQPNANELTTFFFFYFVVWV